MPESRRVDMPQGTLDLLILKTIALEPQQLTAAVGQILNTET